MDDEQNGEMDESAEPDYFLHMELRDGNVEIDVGFRTDAWAEPEEFGLAMAQLQSGEFMGLIAKQIKAIGEEARCKRAAKRFIKAIQDGLELVRARHLDVPMAPPLIAMRRLMSYEQGGEEWGD